MDLPWQFCSKLSQARNSKERDTILIAFVDAFASVGDPLVIISTKEDNFVFPPSNFLFFCCDEMRDKDHVMSVLFPSTGLDVTPSDLPSTTAAAYVTEGTKDGQGNMEEGLVKMLQAFRQCEKIDITGTIDILGVLLSWLQQNKPLMGFYDQLVEETRSVSNHFERITFSAKEKYSYPSLEVLYSYWQDGEAKLNLIIDTLISKKMSKEASERNTKDVTLEEREIVTPVEVKKEFKEREVVVGTPKKLFWEEVEAFQQGRYQKEDVKSITNLLTAALSLLDEKESLRSFDEHLIGEMKIVYISFSDLLARGDVPTLEDLYSQWAHGEIKLKLIIDTLLSAHKRNFSDNEEASKRRPVESKLVEENTVAKTGEGSSSKPNIQKPKGKNSNKSRKKGRKNRG